MTPIKSNPLALQLRRPTEAARILACTVQTLSNFRAKGTGPRYIKLGSAVRYSDEALREYVEARERQCSRGTSTRKAAGGT